MAQWQRILLPMRETWVRLLSWEDTQEKEMTTHSCILAWEIPWMEEPGRLQLKGSQRAGHDLATEQQQRERKKKNIRLLLGVGVEAGSENVLEMGLGDRWEGKLRDEH